MTIHDTAENIGIAYPHAFTAQNINTCIIQGAVAEWPG